MKAILCMLLLVNLSEKDTKHEVLKDFESPFEY